MLNTTQSIAKILSEPLKTAAKTLSSTMSNTTDINVLTQSISAENLLAANLGTIGSATASDEVINNAIGTVLRLGRSYLKEAADGSKPTHPVGNFVATYGAELERASLKYVPINQWDR